MANHPLSDVHFGRPRKSMINMYFGGYFYLGLLDARLRIVFRPTDTTSKDVHADMLHMTVYQKP